MTLFSLPATTADNRSAFSDAASATRWLAGQPLANATAMLGELVKQVEAFNVYAIAPRQRFKTMEVLRKAIFAVSGECRRRYENKALPLLSSEQTAFSDSRRLWRACSVAYVHCLQACLDGDTTLNEASAMVAHRVVACLRMEQLACYGANHELGDDFWQLTHALWRAGEVLGVERQAIADRLLGETSDSTLNGQFSMIVLLQLARPFSLSRSQFGAAIRWFARWREQAMVLTAPEQDPKSCCLTIDLAQDRALHDNLRPPTLPRWLSLSGVLRKMRQRLDLLAKGESPESLKLGTLLTADACTALLGELGDQLRYPDTQSCETPAGASSITLPVASGLENAFRLLGGKGLRETTASSGFGNTLSAEQIAVFGHIVRPTEEKAYAGEAWHLASETADGESIRLARLVGTQEARLSLNGLLALKRPNRDEDECEFALATITTLYVCRDGRLCLTASVLGNEPTPLVAEIRERPSGKQSRHPAFLLPGTSGGHGPLSGAVTASVVLPAGLAARALGTRFFEAREQSLFPLKPVDCIRRGSDHEIWALAPRA